MNTYFHSKPFLDIASHEIGDWEPFDFIIASEVFEHIPSYLQHAFNNLNKLLKPGGFILFTVPWSRMESTIEHFPFLHQWVIVDLAGKPVLLNRKTDGQLETFEDLVFHGGPGHTLEMRVFSLSALNSHFYEAGLKAVFGSYMTVDNGTIFPDPWSLPAVVEKRLDLKREGRHSRSRFSVSGHLDCRSCSEKDTD